MCPISAPKCGGPNSKFAFVARFKNVGRPYPTPAGIPPRTPLHAGKVKQYSTFIGEKLANFRQKAYTQAVLLRQNKGRETLQH